MRLQYAVTPAALTSNLTLFLFEHEILAAPKSPALFLDYTLPGLNSSWTEPFLNQTLPEPNSPWTKLFLHPLTLKLFDPLQWFSPGTAGAQVMRLTLVRKGFTTVVITPGGARCAPAA